MAVLFGKRYTRAELLRKVGSVSQLGGTRLGELRDGNEKGVSAIDMATGAGLDLTILPDRGMDISSASFCGRSLCWRSCTGDVGPGFYEPDGLGWLRGFYGGLVVTCGLTYVGAPCVDQGEELGLHGRVSNTPAKNVVHGGYWKGNDYIMYAGGEVREACVYGANMVMRRSITATLGESRFFIHDTVTNEGFEKTPHMILYHINTGFPVMDETSELISPTKQAVPRDEIAAEGAKDFAKFHEPKRGYREKVYAHDMGTDSKGKVTVGLANPEFDNGNGFGLYVSYLKRELPSYTEWKMMGQGNYVVGIEPANCGVTGRDKSRESGELVVLKPGESREYHVEIGILHNNKEIDALRRQTRRIVAGKKRK